MHKIKYLIVHTLVVLAHNLLDLCPTDVSQYDQTILKLLLWITAVRKKHKLEYCYKTAKRSNTTRVYVPICISYTAVITLA